MTLKLVALCNAVAIAVFAGSAAAVGRQAAEEAQRLQFHFTPERGWMNDPNGLCRYRGEWHLFYQSNPDGLSWGNMRWGHAVSKDLVRWKRLPVALEADQYGTVFSGSAVIDHENVAGFGKDELLLFYTAAGKTFTQRMAHSGDGRTFEKVPGDPVLPTHGPQNRDPHVFRYRDGRWVMVVYVPGKGRHNFNIYNSTDLKNWKLASVYGGPTFEEIDFYDWELPQLFELPVAGTDETRWVLMGASGNYALGTFDGAVFTPLAKNIPGVIRCEAGGSWPKPNWPKFGYNSSLVYAGVEDGRTILQSWYHLFTSGVDFTQAAGLPLEVKLLPTQEGPRLAYFPVEELRTLRDGDPVGLPDFEGELLEAEVSCAVSPGAAVTYDFRGVQVRYDRNRETLTICGETVPWRTEYGKLSLHVYQDRLGIEVFDPNGLQAFVQPKAVPDRTGHKVKIACDGTVREMKGLVWKLKSAFTADAESGGEKPGMTLVLSGRRVESFDRAQAVLRTCRTEASDERRVRGFRVPFYAPGGAYGANWWQLDHSVAVQGVKWYDSDDAARGLDGFADVIRADGRIPLYGDDILPKRKGWFSEQSEGVSSLPAFFRAAHDVAVWRGDRAFARRMANLSFRYLNWWRQTRGDPKTGLVTAVFEETFPPYLGRAGECSSPGTCAEVAQGALLTAELCRLLGDVAREGECRDLARSLFKAARTHLWSADDAQFRPRDVRTRSFLPADALGFSLLQDPDLPDAIRDAAWATALGPRYRSQVNFGLTSVARDDARYKITRSERYQGNDSWNGMVWTLINVRVIDGLLTCGRVADAVALAKDTVRMLEAEDDFYEFYDPTDGKGCGVKGYAWTAADYLQLVLGRLLGISYDGFTRTLTVRPRIAEDFCVTGVDVPGKGRATIRQVGGVVTCAFTQSGPKGGSDADAGRVASPDGSLKQ